MDDKTVTLVVSSIVGLLPLLANAALSAIQGNTGRSRRDDAIAVARARIQLLDEWIKAQESVSTPDHYAELKQTASQELDSIHQGVIRTLATSEPRHERIRDRDAVQRIFLLYRPLNPISWLLHTLFYMSAAMSLAVVLLTAIHLITGTALEIPDYIEYGINLAVPLLVFALIFRWLGVLVDHQAEKQQEAEGENGPAIPLP